jgi:acyl-homoserine-lactone acylase
MSKWLPLLIVFFVACSSTNPETEIHQHESSRKVTIIRDQFGVPHIYGKTDADVVFGLMYAQCEESFEKMEESYLRILGRMSEKKGEGYYYQDLLMKTLYDTSTAKKDFEAAPDWLKKLLYAFSDGIHHYLSKHPETKPALLKRFEPWYPLLFSDGAYISTNTGGLEQRDLQELFGKENRSSRAMQPGINESALTGSNAFAIAPQKSTTGNAILFINPHVSFYFRTEVHMVSEEGLNAYGAATWGQFFIYQGFNESLGWMHTSSLADAADLYEEKIVEKNNGRFYQYNNELKPVEQRKTAIHILNNGSIQTDSVNIMFTGHGPVLGKRNGKHLSLRSQNHSLQGLIQSWQRMKSKDFEEFKKNLALRTNNSTNTMYADNKGNIAYWHGNFVPKRDPAYKWDQPVDGTIAATEWKGMHTIDELVGVVNPPTGWMQNCNSSPFHISGKNAIAEAKFPSYMAPEAENFRSVRAIELLSKQKKWSAEELVSISMDGYLSMFDTLLPSFIDFFYRLPPTDPARSELEEPMSILEAWDKKASINSVASTLAIFWAYQVLSMAQQNAATLDNIGMAKYVSEKMPGAQKLDALRGVMNGLQRIYGDWKIAWGSINRFQRTDYSDQRFSDSKESLPVGFASAFFGCLASYETIWGEGNKQFGIAGNSFVAVVEFGKKIRARSVVTGGQFFDPSSKHFNDQAEMFVTGRMKEVNFYREDVERNSERKYRP